MIQKKGKNTTTFYEPLAIFYNSVMSRVLHHAHYNVVLCARLYTLQQQAVTV